MKQVANSTDGTPSDAELILQVRAGDRDAFGVLYERHSGAARALARQYVPLSDVDDVVADAFSKLFEMLRRGAGPDAGFRTYLYTVVRHRAFDVTKGASRTRPSTDDEIESVLGRVASNEDPALAGFEASVVSKAYFDLPDRWREVLWCVLVDDLKPADVAPLLGLTPNGVSALLYRAKEALRAGYLQQHLTQAPSDMCRTVNPLLGGYVRKSLSRRETTKIEDHLSTCGTCSALVLELQDVAHGMKTVIAPLVLGAGGLALVGAGTPIGGLFAAAKAGAGAAVGGAPTASVTAGVASTGTFSGAVSSAVSTTASAIASAAAAATGGSVAAGAIAVAAVSIVAALQGTASSGDLDQVVGTDSVIASNEGKGLVGVDEVDDEAALPGGIDPAGTTSLAVGYTHPSKPLAARETETLSFTVTNTGTVEATGTQLELTLPEGLSITRPGGPFGTGVGSVAPATVETPDGASTEGTQSPSTPPAGSTGKETPGGEVQADPSSSPETPATTGGSLAACLPTELDNVLLCSLGDLAPDGEYHVDVPVKAGSGGEYAVGAEVWADGVAHVGGDLPARTVTPFGKELSAQTEDVSLASPGVAALPVRVVSTGDVAVAGGWSVKVSLPAEVAPASAQPELSCTPGGMANDWSCSPIAGSDAAAAKLEPGTTVAMPLNITTATESSGEPSVLGVANVLPVLDGRARSASATLAATSAWANASAGVGSVAASCAATGGVGTADAVVTGTYTNTTQRTVQVALEAAGGSASTGKDLAPGEKVTLTVHDGLRVPAGRAIFVLSTVVDGSTYTTRVAANEHKSVDCYAPGWSSTTSARTFNAGGNVGVEGTITNTSSEPFSVVMVVPVGESTVESENRVVPAGKTVRLTVNTQRSHMDAGEVTFRPSRSGADSDGDEAPHAYTPEKQPRAKYAAATIAPAQGASVAAGGVCEFDPAQDRSVQRFDVMADNTRSTLPVEFRVGETKRTVPAGESLKIEFPVVWGTGTMALEAAGKKLVDLKVEFPSCATLEWTADTLPVGTEAKCIDGQAHLLATVDNRTGRDWTGVLLREGSGDSSAQTAVPAGAATTLDVVRMLPFSNEGTVTVQLTRELEGVTHTVERSFGVSGVACGGEACKVASAAPSAMPGMEGPRWPWSGFCGTEPRQAADGQTIP